MQFLAPASLISVLISVCTSALPPAAFMYSMLTTGSDCCRIRLLCQESADRLLILCIRTQPGERNHIFPVAVPRRQLIMQRLALL